MDSSIGANAIKPWTIWAGDKPDKASGFIYVIHNAKTNRFYIGKKGMYRPKKGKSGKKLSSDWRNYCGSSNALLEDIEGNEEHIHRFIVEWCNSKWEMAYAEMMWQLNANVLADDRFYNGIIAVKIGRKPKATPMEFMTRERNIFCYFNLAKL